MVLLQPEVKSLFQDVLSFLSQLDNLTNLQKSTSQSLKQRIESLIGGSQPVISPETEDQEIYDEAESDGQPVAEDSGSAAVSTVSSKDEPEIVDLSPASLQNATKQGYLEKRRPDSLMYRLASHPYQKRYCAIQNGIFYYFDNQNSKKQSGAFYIKEYEARPAYHLVKSGSKKEGSFEMVAPGQRSYQFIAKDFEEMKEWISAIAECSEHPHPPVSSLTRPNESSEKTTSVHSSGSDTGSINIGGVPLVTEEAGEYVDSDLKAASPTPPPSKRRSPPQPAEPQEEIYDEGAVGDDDQELYDEANVEEQVTYDEAAAAPERPVKSPAPKGKVLPPPPAQSPAPNTSTERDSQEIYDCVEEEENYDEAGVDSTSPTANKKPAAPIEARPGRPLPAEPEPEPEPEHKVLSARSDDYENMFYALWDRETSCAHELSFKSGEIIHIVDREHDSKQWWTAVLDGKVGLVPKTFLTSAYAAV